MGIAAIIFIIFLLAVAGVTFFILKRTIKMAIRAIVVLLILLVAIAGSFALWHFGFDSTPFKKSVKTKKAR